MIMIDELDELQRHEWSKTFFNNLRHLISQSSLQKNISMLIAGTLAIYSLYTVAGSPFLNVISGTKKLRLLTLEEASQLINTPTGGQRNPALTDLIYEQTGGHPFLIQYIMKNLCDELGDSLASAKSITSTRLWINLSPSARILNWSSRFTDNGQTVYRMIASSESPVRKFDLVQAAGNAEAANDSIELLAHLGLIREPKRNFFEMAVRCSSPGSANTGIWPRKPARRRRNEYSRPNRVGADSGCQVGGTRRVRRGSELYSDGFAKTPAVPTRIRAGGGAQRHCRAMTKPSTILTLLSISAPNRAESLCVWAFLSFHCRRTIPDSGSRPLSETSPRSCRSLRAGRQSASNRPSRRRA